MHIYVFIISSSFIELGKLKEMNKRGDMELRRASGK